jgi:hypothetical protein
MSIDPSSFERVLIAGLLASLAIAIAFGPELGRAISRLRNRRLVDEVSETPSLGAEAQQS